MLHLSTKNQVRVIALGASLCVAMPAFAHPGAAHVHGLMDGVMHPLSGLDHLLAMLAVGLWAAQHQRPVMWLLPLVFPLMMVAGAMAGMGSAVQPGVEVVINMSVVALGLLVAFAVRMPIWASALLVSVCAVAHGYAHGVELPADASAAVYIAGFVAATFVLHLLGLAGGVAGKKATGLIRWSGAGIAAVGVGLLTGIA